VSPSATPVATRPFHHHTKEIQQMTSSTRRTAHRLGVAAGACALAIAVAAPAASATTVPPGSEAPAPADPAAAAAAAGDRVAPYLEPATSIGIDAPVEGEIPTDVSVYWLEGNIQSILPITTGFEGATEALGWDLNTLSYDPSDPQSPGAAMQQAVDGGADYIAVSGQTTDILGTALESAMSAGIPVIDMYSTDEIGGEDNGIYANIGSPEYSRASYPLLADLIISDSGGDANVLVVSVPDFAILTVATDAINEHFAANCPDCSVQALDLSITDLTGGTVASQVVSTIQSNPDIEYVYVTFGDLATGLPEALSSADLGDVKLVGHVPNPEQLQSLADGTSFAWIPLPRPESGWAAVDAMVRLAVGQEIDQAQHEVLPIEIWTSDNVPTPVEEFEGPEGYQDQFTALWGGGGAAPATTAG
jgi:ABC-type sugar transport system substrate-binding protein